MASFSREILLAYLDDSLGDVETAQIEQALRESAPLRQQLQGLIQERDRGEHSVGAIWRRQRLTCPSREQLGSFLLGVLEPKHQEYIEFHLKTIACAYCQANLADLKSQRQEMAKPTKQRLRKFFESGG